MNILVGLVLCVLVILCFGVYLLFCFLLEKIKILFGYKKYEFTKILSHGMKDDFAWFKTDEEALKYRQYHYEFISEIKPNKRRIKPLN